MHFRRLGILIETPFVKRIISLFLAVIPLISIGQYKHHGESVKAQLADSLGKFIEWTEDNSFIDDVFPDLDLRKGGIYVIHDEINYSRISRTLFRYRNDSLPKVDFSHQELVVKIYCPVCYLNCEHREFQNSDPCHRGICCSNELWFIREKRQVLLTRF